MPDRKIQYVPLDEIQLAERNAKTHNVPGIGASMERFGVIEIMARDDRTGRLIAGHGRYESIIAARESGAEQPPEGVKVRSSDGAWLAPVVTGWSSNDDQEADAAALALNRQGELGGWDEELREEILRGLDDRTATGFELPEADLDGLDDETMAEYGLDSPDGIDVTVTPDLEEEELRPYEFGFVLIRFELEAAGAIASAIGPLDGAEGVFIRQTMK